MRKITKIGIGDLLRQAAKKWDRDLLEELQRWKRGSTAKMNRDLLE